MLNKQTKIIKLFIIINYSVFWFTVVMVQILGITTHIFNQRIKINGINLTIL